MSNSRYKILPALFLLISVVNFPFSVRAQVRPVNDYGANGLAQLLKRLNTTRSVLMIGAHPDDEDSALLAYLARGENARTAYLSLTRGDGGQNIIGSELFEPLGIIRTEELLQARRLDGAQQFFTRAFDFGFTKTLAETKEKWDEKIILCDTVRAIRAFRPLVVVSRFSGTTADGHGQHQYAGYISLRAVRAAADANHCKDAGAAWRVLKFYVEQGFRDTTKPTLKINTGAYDALLGRSYAEIAAEGRSQHKTQEQGGLELKGDRFSGLNLIESNMPKVAGEKSVFDGIDTSLAGAPKLFVKDESSIGEYTKNQLAAAQQSAERALKEYNPNEPQKIVPILVEGQQALNRLSFSYAAFSGTPERQKKFDERRKNEPSVESISWEKLNEFKKAIQLALGIQIDALVNRESVTRGESFLASVKVFYPENPNVKYKEINISAPSDWQISPAEVSKTDSPPAPFFRENANESKFFNVKVPSNQKLTQPYFLENPRDGSLYVWNDLLSLNLPFQYPLISGCATFEIYGKPISFGHSVEYRYADETRGEVRRELNVVPKISLSINQNLLVVPLSDKPQTRKLALNVKNNSSTTVSGSTDFRLPLNWEIKQNFGVFQLNGKGESKSFEFDVVVPANTKAGEYDIRASAGSGGEETFNQTMNEIAYPHIQTHRFYTDAKARVEVLDLKTAPVRVGYIMGSGDAVPEAIREMGLTVDLLTDADLTGGELSKYDVIVVGIRAYQVREDLVSNNRRLLDYVKEGGNLIVQYQRPDYVAQSLEPFPASMTDTQKTAAGTTARVVDETAKVTVLQPAHPVFNFPNKITDADFGGWVQERNLYNFTTFDERYTPLLEAHDAGELENTGGMVFAKVGRGNYVYTSYSFFRQLPAGVSGAYRLFANLLALPKNVKR
ncbi:MAG: PIG-L family deacetylase [Acidobacteria bacterium]|nr:PIG-L family deacetylase [Acidobacteriota bacterium]